MLLRLSPSSRETSPSTPNKNDSSTNIQTRHLALIHSLVLLAIFLGIKILPYLGQQIIYALHQGQETFSVEGSD